MKAKDTVMRDEQLEELLGVDFRTAYSGHVAEYRSIAKAQAETSFKAGYMLGTKDTLETDVPFAKQEVRKEVVEWIDKNLEPYWRSVSTTKHDYYITLSLADTWQAKLKEWGIEK